MWILLHLFFLLSPEQKSLVAMARQGDMIAADQLVTDICAMPGEARQKAAGQVRKRLKSKHSKAVDMINAGLDRCAPVGKGAAAQSASVKPAKLQDVPRRRGTSGRSVLIPGADLQEPARDGAVSSRSGRRKPISATNTAKSSGQQSAKKPVKNVVAKKMPEKKQQAQKASSPIVRRAAKKTSKDQAGATAKSSASLDALPDGDVDTPRKKKSGTKRSRKLVVARDDVDKGVEDQDLPALEPLNLTQTDASQESAMRPAHQTRMADLDRNQALKTAMTFYGIGGGFIAVATASYVGAVIALGSGAYQQMQLTVPSADSSLETADGRTEQDVYDAQVAAIWTSAGMMSAIAAVTATAELIAGFVLFSQGDAALE